MGVKIHVESKITCLPPFLPSCRGHRYKLQYDLDNTWSMKYNILFQEVLQLSPKPFPPDVMSLESAFYADQMNAFGVPLDNRATFTKLDWSMWVGALGSEDQFSAIAASVLKFANACTDRVPLSDWVFTQTPTVKGFRARPVMGGIYAKLLLQHSPSDDSNDDKVHDDGGADDGGGDCDSCAEDAFPVTLDNTQCYNLDKQGAVQDPDACRAACCASKTCNVWQFCSGEAGDSCNGPSCWTGSGVDLSACSNTSKLHQGWVSQGTTAPICL